MLSNVIIAGDRPRKGACLDMAMSVSAASWVVLRLFLIRGGRTKLTSAH